MCIFIYTLYSTVLDFTYFFCKLKSLLKLSNIIFLIMLIGQEFSNFVKILEKTRKKLQEAQDTIESAEKKTRTIERKLKSVAEISEQRASYLLSDGEENSQSNDDFDQTE